MDNNGPQWVNVRVRGRLEPPPIAEFAAEFVSAEKNLASQSRRRILSAEKVQIFE